MSRCQGLKLLLLQTQKLITLVLERWDDACSDESESDGIIDDDVVRQERLREQLRRRGVNV